MENELLIQIIYLQKLIQKITCLYYFESGQVELILIQTR